MNCKFNEFINSLDAERFKELYITKTREELCEIFDISIHIIKKTIRYFDLKRTKEETKILKARFYNKKDWSDANEKRRKTTIEKFGVDNINKLETTKTKIKETKLERYGDPSFHNVEKMIETNIKKYGCKSAFAAESIKRKIKETNIIKYGADNPQKNKEIQEKTFETNLKKYGVKYYTELIPKQNTNTLESIAKCIETKKRNRSFNKSKFEEEYFDKLKEKFGEENIVRQYKSLEYPFACDFFIKGLNIYIELNLHWTHGGHEFTGSEKDLEILKIWSEKSKVSKFFKNAITTWTIRDIKKIKIAKENKLKYEYFYSYEDAILFLENFKGDQ